MTDDWRVVWDKLQPKGTFEADLLLSWLPGGTVWVDAGSSITTRDSFLTGYRIPDAAYSIRIDDDFITFDRFCGTLYGGQVRGEMRFARKSDRFVSQLVLSNVDLKQFHDEHGFEWDIRGELCGTVNLSGLTNDKNSLDGNAELQIRNGQLASINVVASMVIQLVNLQWTGGSAITDMDVVCKLKDGKVHFGDDQKDERGEILLSGPGVPIAGAGTITLGGDMDLVFVTSKESKQGLSAVLRSIPLLGKVWGLIDDNIFAAIRDQLIKVKVTGNVMDPEPKVSAQPLVVIIGPVKSFWKAVFGSSAPEETKPDASTTPKQ